MQLMKAQKRQQLKQAERFPDSSGCKKDSSFECKLTDHLDPSSLSSYATFSMKMGD
jgi:hypothetical protein